MNVNAADRLLLAKAETLLLERYSRGRHHAAAALRCGARTYVSLHLDSAGIDVCAEPSAIAAAVCAGEEHIDAIVAVQWAGDSAEPPWIVPPCGDCRQLLVEYAPKARVVIRANNELLAVSAEELLPYPYHNHAAGGSVVLLPRQTGDAV